MCTGTFGKKYGFINNYIHGDAVYYYNKTLKGGAKKKKQLNRVIHSAL